ncbi:CocE/NonD family hydrolase [Nonomuraea terrae]|uniref:Xaa-Pro dipeptidyl-peptidase n=1 Tax=Nonomuraea terrae TaxID=2530383 RepID=A0A4R4Y3B2_9ACTN|nr:CocE/NonD family hydrolase [Nonomuraea terrae]
MRFSRTVSVLSVTAVITALGMGTPSSAEVQPAGISVENGVTQPVYNYSDAIQEVVYVETPMDSDGDGSNDLIAMDIIRPRETESGVKIPTIMEASPYYGRSSQPPPDRTRGFPGWWDEYFVPRGYAVAQVEMQGTGRSFGCPTTGGPEDTISIKAAVDWLNGRARGFHADGSAAVADWSTGNVGMQGVSYVGTLPNAVATEGVPGLRTVVPIAAISNWYSYANDQGIAWASWGTRYTEYLANYVSVGRSAPGSASAEACEARIDALGDAEQASDSDFTPFWQERDYIPAANKIKTGDTSVFMVHGMTDYNVKTMHFANLWYEVAKRQMPRKIWIHRGAHSNPTSFRNAEWQSVMHRWMDHWLYDIDNGVMDEPMADIQRPDGSWETHSSWPDASTSPVSLSFGPATGEVAGTLSPDAPTGNPTQSFVDQIESQAVKVGDPSEARPGRLVYVTPPLTEELRLSGTPSLDVRMSTNATGSLLSAMVVDYGEGTSVTVAGKEPLELVQEPCQPEDLVNLTGCATPMEVTEAITPQRVLAWGHVNVQNMPDLRRSDELTPGKKYQVRWNTLPTEHVIPAGHRIGLVLTGNYNADPGQVRPARDQVSVGSEITIDLHGSKLSLPVVDGTDGLRF